MPLDLEQIKQMRQWIDKPGGFEEWFERDDVDALVSEVERQRERVEELEHDADAFFGEMATLLGPGKPPAGVSRGAYWIGRVAQALGERESRVEELEAEKTWLRERLHEAQREMDTARVALSENDQTRGSGDVT